MIGGYTVAGGSFDALIFGYYDQQGLKFAAKTRNGFTPALRKELLKRMLPLKADGCPFINLPRNGPVGGGKA